MSNGTYTNLAILIFVIGISTYMGIGAVALLGVVFLVGIVGSILWQKVQGDEDE